MVFAICLAKSIKMKKTLLVALISLFTQVEGYGQMSISGRIFAENPSRFNGRVITLKDIRVKTNQQSSVVNTPVKSDKKENVNSKSKVIPLKDCITPKGYKQFDVEFTEKPDFIGCFFIGEDLLKQFKKETIAKSEVDIQLTVRGDSRTGYTIISYSLGKSNSQ
jgi:hypothetical protein